MLLYLHVAGVAVVAGAIYALIRVPSPAPPIIAIVGLAGMLVAGTVLEVL